MKRYRVYIHQVNQTYIDVNARTREGAEKSLADYTALRANTIAVIGSVLEAGDHYGDELGNIVIKQEYFDALRNENERLRQGLERIVEIACDPCMATPLKNSEMFAIATETLKGDSKGE